MVVEKKLKIDDKDFKFQWLKGKVLEVKALAKTVGGGTIYIHPGISTTSNIDIESIEQLDLFLEDASGGEHAFKLENFNFSCRAGHEVTIIKLMMANYKNGSIVGLFNHTTKDHRVKDYLLRNLSLPDSTFSWLLGLATPFVLGKVGYEILKYFMGGLMGADRGSILMTTLVLTFLFSIVVWILLIVLYQSKKNRKYRKLRNAYNNLDIT